MYLPSVKVEIRNLKVAFLLGKTILLVLFFASHETKREVLVAKAIPWIVAFRASPKFGASAAL